MFAFKRYNTGGVDEVDCRYDLTDNQWAIAKAILNLLEFNDQVTTTLSGEKYFTLSWSLPLMFVWLV